MMSDSKMIYYISDLFKCPDTTAKEFVNADDPFIGEDVLNHYCCSAFPPYKSPSFGEGIDTAYSLGPGFFKEANSIQNAREEERLAEETVKERAEEEQLKEERIVKKQLDDKVAKLMGKHKVYLKRSCPVKIPFKSQLTHEEHELYLSAFLKYQGRAPKNSLEQQEFQRYLCLQFRVFAEQKELMDFSQKVAALRLKEYNDVPPVIEEYVTRYLKHGFSRVLQYPRLYHLEQEVPLRPQDPHNVFAGLVFEHLGHLLSLGVVPWIKLPYPNSLVTFPSNQSFLNKHPPEETPKSRFRRSDGWRTGGGQQTFLCNTTVSEDPNCEYLAVQHRASVVLTPSVLKTLLDNPSPNFDKEWDVPVVVRSYPVTEADGSTSQHRVVYIDKPIKKKLWTPLEKKSLFFKKSGVSTITLFRNRSMFKMKSPPVFLYLNQKDESNFSPPRSYKPSVPDPDDDSLNFDTTDKRPLKCAAESPFVDSKVYVKRNFVPFVSSRDGSSYGDSVFDDPFGASEVDTSESDVFGVASSDVPRRRPVIEATSSRRRSSKKQRTKSHSEDSGIASENVNCDSSTKDNKGVASPNSELDGATGAQKQNVSNLNSSLKKEEEEDDDGSGTGVLADLLGGQTSMFQASSGKHSCGDGSAGELGMGQRMERLFTKDYAATHDTKLPWTKTVKTEWGGHTKARVPTPGTTVNYHYHLYKLHTSSPATASTTTNASLNLPAITVLARNHLHGLSLERSSRPDMKFRSSAYVLFPKLEHQLFFGCEVSTHTEVLHQWTQLLCRPNSYIMQARVCAATGEVVLGEERSLVEVVREGHQTHVHFDPAASLTSLYAVLDTLRRMPTGAYLLHHHNKSEAFIRLMRNAGDDGVSTGHQSMFDLHASYGYGRSSTGEECEPVPVIDSRQYVKPPWLAIDTHVPTPFHLKHKKIPATFPMANPDKKLTKKRKRFIKERAKNKQCIYDAPTEAAKNRTTKPNKRNTC